MVSLYLGPSRERWTPRTWADVTSAAAAGLLDEQRWVELKKAIPAASKNANRELAKDLAALACDGGVMIVGIEELGDGRAGDVTGTPLAGLQDRISQVAGSALISPPLVVRTVVIPHPTTADHGCLLVIVDPSVDGPHMVEGSYRGRSDIGTRMLADIEVRRHLEQNAQRRDDFADAFTEARGQALLGGPGVLQLFFRPRSSRRGALSARLAQANVLLHEVTKDLPTKSLWNLFSDLRHVRRIVRGVVYSDIRAEDAESANFAQRASEYDANLVALRLLDDGTFLVSCSRLVYPTGDVSTSKPLPALSIAGVLAITEQATVMVSRLADQAGYGGGWDVGLAITGLKGCRPGIEGHRSPGGHYGADFPDDEHQEFTSITTAELHDSPHLVPDRLLRELYRVLGSEQQADNLKVLRPGSGS